METQDFSTVIEFVSNKANNVVAATSSATSAQTADNLFFLICALVAVCGLGFIAYYLIKRKLAFNNEFSNTKHYLSSSAKLPNFDKKNSKFVAILIALVLTLCVSLMILPSLRANAEPESNEEFPASIPQKVVATVDSDTGDISFDACKITNSGSKLSVGTRKVTTECTGDLAGATLTVKSGEDTIYSSTIGSTQIQDDYFLVPKGSSADLTFSLTIDKQKAKTLVGNASITMTTTVDLTSTPSGVLLNADDTPAANADVDYTYIDPYTEKVVTGHTTTDENGVYNVETVKLNTNIIATFTSADGATKTLKITADDTEQIPNQKISEFAEVPEPKKNLVYTGEIQSGFAQVDNVTLENFTAIKAGDYVATATPNEGFYWRDMTQTPIDIQWSIAKADSEITNVPTAISPTYSGSAQNLVTAGVTKDGTLNYGIGGATEAPTSWNASIPQGTGAGLYYVWYKVIGDSNHNDSKPACVPANINKADVTDFVAPFANTLTYTGVPQSLTTEGTVTGGEFKYSLSENEQTQPTEWYDTVQTGTDADDYYAWYKVIGDKNHNDKDPAYVKVTINKADPVVTKDPVAKTGLVYTGENLALVEAGTCTGGTMIYCGPLSEKKPSKKDFKEDIPTAMKAGSYKIAYMVSGDSNHNDSEFYYIDGIKISQATPTLKLDTTATYKIGVAATIDTEYDGDGTLSASSSDDTKVTVAVDSTDKTKINVTAVAVGTATITVSASAGTNYAAVSDKNQAATIEEAKKYSVKFDMFGYTGDLKPADQTVIEGKTAEEKTITSVSPYEFDGWYTSDEMKAEDKYDFDTPVTENITLYGTYDTYVYGIWVDEGTGNAPAKLFKHYPGMTWQDYLDNTKYNKAYDNSWEVSAGCSERATIQTFTKKNVNMGSHYIGIELGTLYSKDFAVNHDCAVSSKMTISGGGLSGEYTLDNVFFSSGILSGAYTLEDAIPESQCYVNIVKS